MNRETLAGFFEDMAVHPGPFLVYDDGLRTRTYTYREVASAARGFAARLHAAGLRKGDAVLFWAENRPEWVAAFWGCILAGCVVVPVDYRSSLAFARRVSTIARARVALVGEDVAATSPPVEPPANPSSAEWWPLSQLDWHDRRPQPEVPHARDDLAEIIFTSGATAEPKGVLISHANILANIVPIEGEVRKYRAWGRPFFPLRFLNLLPLSHMFGQALATFIPPMLPGTTIFMRGYNPAEIIAQVRKRRVSVLVSVPKILEVLAEHVQRTLPLPEPSPHHLHVARRWWRYRAVHRAFGLKFWCFVVGAAPLEPALEETWSRVGFLVIQGYGLTETAPIVSLNHPFNAQKGSVGKAIGGVSIRIAPDGEILVKGENVARGYLGSTAEPGAFDDGWLHTGDIGEVDVDGRLFVKGRKKEMIVRADGLNVFPEDVERAVNRQPGVRESAVVGVRRGAGEQVHAVLVLQPGTDPERVVRDANGELAEHQRIRSFSEWPGEALPRTEGTQKLKRQEVRRWAETGVSAAPAASPGGHSIEALLERYAAGRQVTGKTTLEELGLSSLDRVELMAAIEDRLQSTVDEQAFAEARTVADLRSLLEPAVARQPAARRGEGVGTMPSWNRTPVVRAIRNGALAAWLLPLTRVFARARVRGLEHVRAIDGPVIFASNHQSHLDTPVILSALPGRVRRRVAVAMAKDFFQAYFHPEGHGLGDRGLSGTLYVLAAFFFNAFPLPQRELGAREALKYIGELVSDEWSVLIYPEGERTERGEIRRFRPGVGMLGARLGVPVIPVRLEGVDRVLHKTWTVPRRGPVTVAFGPELKLEGQDFEALARKVESAVRAL